MELVNASFLILHPGEKKGLEPHFWPLGICNASASLAGIFPQTPQDLHTPPAKNQYLFLVGSGLGVRLRLR